MLARVVLFIMGMGQLLAFAWMRAVADDREKRTDGRIIDAVAGAAHKRRRCAANWATPGWCTGSAPKTCPKVSFTPSG